MNHELWEELLAARALGRLDDAENRQLEEHLRQNCPICDELLGTFNEIASGFALLDTKAPPPEAKDELLRKISATIPQPLQAHQDRAIAFSSQRLFSRKSIYGGLAFAAASLIIALLLLNPIFQSRHDDSVQLAHARVEVLRHADLNIEIGKETAGLSGDILGISPDGRVQNLIMFSRNTKAKFIGDSSGIRIDLEQGDALSLVRPGTHFQVATAVSVAGARGTVFYVRADSEDTTYICICHGSIDISAGGQNEILESAHHKAVFVNRRGGVITFSPGTLLGHSDSDVRTLESF